MLAYLLDDQYTFAAAALGWLDDKASVAGEHFTNMLDAKLGGYRADKFWRGNPVLLGQQFRF